MTNKNVLCLLAHQDDEYFIAPFLIREQRKGNLVTCVYLTSGGAYGVDSMIRNEESLKALSSIGITEKNVSFLGSELRCFDSTIMSRCQEILDALKEKLDNKKIFRIYCPAWEGGHSDHDTTHLIALAFSKSRAIMPATWQFSLYHRYRMPKYFFRVMSLLDKSDKSFIERFPFLVAFKCAFLFLNYPSQWKTWLGLSPEAVLKILLLRRIRVKTVSTKKVFERPHVGPLLYESRFDISHEEFMKKTKCFRESHFLEQS